jgi:hypothetical protein
LLGDDMLGDMLGGFLEVVCVDHVCVCVCV